MYHLGRLAAAAAVIGICSTALAADSGKQDRETVLLPEDKLAVTVGSSGLTGSLGDESEYSIWVGEVDLEGRKAVWVELIDEQGEVVYDSEVRQNETHLLPDGRAIVVKALTPDGQEKTVVAKQDESRIAPDARLIVTRRIIDDENNHTAIEFIEEKPRQEHSALMALAEFGHQVWSSIVVAFEAAADGVKVALNWLFGATQA